MPTQTKPSRRRLPTRRARSAEQRAERREAALEALRQLEPNPRRETMVAYHAYAPIVFRLAWGLAPSRNSLSKYLGEGFPIRRGGPFVPMPAWRAGKRPWTTMEALDRWVELVRTYELNLDD